MSTFKLKKMRVLHSAKLSALSFSLIFSNSLSLADTSSANPVLQVAQPQIEQKSFLSKFDLSIINRYWFKPASQNNFLSNEIGVRRGLTESLSLGVSVEYYQMTSTNNAENSDFQDMDLSLSYLYRPTPSEQKAIDWDTGASLLISLPTSRSSKSQGEYAGVGAKLFVDFVSNFTVVSLSTRFYEYFYENSYIPTATASAPTKSEPGTQPEIPPTFLTTALTPSAPTLTANCNNFGDSSLVTLFKFTPSFMFRNEVRYEFFGYFDDHYTNSLHDKFGFGYKFAPEFAVWLSQDAAKDTNLSGSIFDNKFITTILSLYWKI